MFVHYILHRHGDGDILHTLSVSSRGLAGQHTDVLHQAPLLTIPASCEHRVIVQKCVFATNFTYFANRFTWSHIFEIVVKVKVNVEQLEIVV